ncbi:unnamed protein product [Rotaria sp. Silwood1]|nr:unnamed protein product [Rotaria sp. Silwood1]CAF3402623.1 unnamed protein product [Rotaria sp. Silwood1]CAF3403144.1 unnamed protein product [Rotaria sp. Silwood1]CAF4573573.1 unnamed protein product [Rotaria sp. Silwood1]CAF4614183.1 unnamed protein product [Rotaria sp. Silwood1]
MVFTAPTVHYSALATLPPELTSSKSHQSIKHTASVRFKMNRIFKKLLHNDIHNEHTIRTEIKEHNQLPKSDVHLSETIEYNNDAYISTAVKNPNNSNTDNRTLTEQESPRSMPSLIEPFERLPFTEPYFSISPKNEKFPFELSTYHKRCIHQEKYIDQKQYNCESSSIKQTKFLQRNPSISTSIKQARSDLINRQLQNSNEQQCQIEYNNKKSNSTTTLPVSTCIENRIGLQYASRRNTVTNSHNIRSSHAQQHTQHLRRLHSKSKIRPIINETKTLSITSQNKSLPLSSISSSIAHRIELLKKAMHNNQLEFHRPKSDKISPIELSYHPLIDKINKETQTDNNQFKSSEFYHVHHHHIHSSSFLSIEWRTYFSIIGTLSIIFLLLIELITIIF